MTEKNQPTDPAQEPVNEHNAQPSGEESERFSDNPHDHRGQASEDAFEKPLDSEQAQTAETHPGQQAESVLSPVDIPDDIGSVIRRGFSLYFRNSIALIILSGIFSVPVFFIQFVIGYDNEALPMDLLIGLTVFASDIRNNLLESALILILPALLYGRGRIDSAFLKYFFGEIFPRIMLWSLIFSPLAIFADSFLPALGILLRLYTIFMVCLISISPWQNPQKTFVKCVGENLLLIRRNLLLSLFAVIFSNIVLIVPVLPVVLFASFALISPEQIQALFDMLSSSSEETLQPFFIADPKYIEWQLTVFAAEVIAAPLKYLVFGIFFVVLMKRTFLEKLAAFFSLFGLTPKPTDTDAPR